MSETPMECPRCRQQGRESHVLEAQISRKISAISYPGFLDGTVHAAPDEPAIGGQYRCSNGHRFEVWWDNER